MQRAWARRASRNGGSVQSFPIVTRCPIGTAGEPPCFTTFRHVRSFLVALFGAPQPLIAQEQITVFAAASLKNALDDTNTAFTKATGVKVVASYEASSALARQIEQGAPADVFISADLRWMDYVAEHKLIKPDTRMNLLGNKLVLIAPADSKLDNVTIEQGFDIAKLAGDGRIAVADVKAVPAGLYAKAALEKLGCLVGRGAKTRAGGKCARDTCLRRARRNAGRHRLRNRCQGRTQGENHRHVS